MSTDDNMHFMPDTSCPHCGGKLDAASPTEEGGRHAPKPDDFSVCIHCAGALRFDAALRPVKATDRDLDEAEADSPGFLRLLRRAQEAARRVKRERMYVH